MASGGPNGASSLDLLGIDIKTEAIDYDEDFDKEWNDELPIKDDSSLPTLTHVITRDPVSNGHPTPAMNGYHDVNNMDEDLSSHSNTSEIMSAAMIKAEPRETLENDYDSHTGRFNLRKRKASTPEGLAPSNKEGNSVAGEEEEVNGKKKRKKILYTYTNSMLQEALDLVHSQNISIMNAAKQYGIPRSTLRRYALTMWAAAAPKTSNRQEPALTPPEEAHLVSMITKMSRAGKYVSTMDVKSTVQHLLDESRRVVFKDRNRPNAGWVQRFRKRHRNLQIKGSGYTMKRQTPLTKQEVADWYKEITQYMANDWEVNIPEFFGQENRHRIFNLDELTVPLNQKCDLIEDSIPKTEDDYTEMTILAAVSAAGECLQPLIVQKGEGGGHEDDIMPLDQTSYGISFSLSGKMNSDIFLRWLEAFDRELCEKGVQKPILIFLDDIFAHFHISVFTYAMDNEIILICLQSQVGTVFQPVESEITESVRDAYRMYCKEHYGTETSPVSMDMFPLTFLRAWEAVRAEEPTLKQKIVDSFAFTGLVPLDPNAPVYADFPLFNEQDQVKLEKSAKRQDPKAKKTVAKKAAPPKPPTTPATTPATGLIPKVKIKKLDKSLSSDHYKIVDGFSPPMSHATELPDSLSAFADTDPLTKVETNWGSPPPPSKTKKASSVHSHLPYERLEGRQDGIKKCIDLMESFIPADLIPIWMNRSDDLKNSCEISYCMWKTVQNLFKDLSKQMEKQARSAASKASKANSKSKCHPRTYVKQKAEADSYLM